MGRAGAKRTQNNGESPSSISAAKKQKTETKKVVPQKVEKPEKKVDADLQALCDKFKNPEDAIQFILANAKMTVDEFFSKHWEKSPLAMHASEESKELTKIFNYEFLCKFVKENEGDDAEFEIAPERDFLLTKLVDNKKDDASVDILTESALRQSFEKEGFGIQFNQPQRFQDCLWSLMEKLECYFGSLVGSQAFCVPSGTQMTGLQYDDLERFHLQLEGSKTFKLYKPIQELASTYDMEIKHDKVGEPILTATLKIGDVLYIPRGVVYESIAETQSTDIAFYTYQGHHTGTLIQQTIVPLVEQMTEKCIDLRRGLPIGFLPAAKSMSHSDYADVLNKLADTIRKETGPLPCPEALVQDFMSFRLPPFGVDDPDFEALKQPTENSKLHFVNKHHITYYTRTTDESQMNEMEADEEAPVDEEDLEVEEVVVMGSYRNSRSKHMMIESRILQTEGESFAIGIEYKNLLETVMKTEGPIDVKSLTEKTKDGKNISPMVLIRGLFSIGALRTE